MKYIQIYDQLNFVLKGIYEIGENITFERDEETNSTSQIQLPKLDTNLEEKKYNIQELDVIEIKDDIKTLYIGIVTKITENQFVEISFKEIINIFDVKIDNLYGTLNTRQKNVGVEDALKYAIDAQFNNGPYAQNSIVTTATTHTPINANIPMENGVFNLATYMNNCKILYDLSIDFSIEPYLNTDSFDLKINIEKKNITTKRTIDLRTMVGKVTENYTGSVMACVTAVGPNYINGTDTQQKDIYILRTDRTIRSLYDGNTDDIVFGSRTTIYVDDWDTYVQEITNQFKGNSYDHLFEFTTNLEYEVGEKIIIYTKKGEQVESYISGKKWIAGGYEYKTGKMRTKFIDKFLKEKKG